MLKIIAGFMAVLLVGCLLRAKDGHISGSDARRMVEAGARLVDVRTPEEFTAEHVSGAINIPVQELDGRLGELEPKDIPVVVYCRSGSRSARAAHMLRNAGYVAVHDLGAMSRW